MRRCGIGQQSLCWLLIGCCFLGLGTRLVRAQDKEDGEYGAPCQMNSDCKQGFVCLLNTCSCDSSYMYDMNKGLCKKICRGSAEALVRHGQTEDQYNLYKIRYTNCSYVDSNLEITGLEKNMDLSFLKDIEEVDGYVLIVNVYSSYLHLENLRIIRGNTLYEQNYSLYVALNHNPANESEGLLELRFNSLKEIMKGQAYFQNNNRLCYVNTIRWDDINPTTKHPMISVFNSENFKRPCEPCPHECYNKVTGHYHCWGSKPNMCQKLNYIKGVCSDACDGRCFGPQPNQCCHAECAAGCTSQKRADCVTCKNFYNDGECHPFCPKMQVYDSTKMTWVANPAGRYSFKSLCVKDCPGYMLKDSDACVVNCPDGKMAFNGTNHCKQCEGACPKQCPGIPEGSFLSANTINDFAGCTVVEGNMKIVRVSFSGDPHSGAMGLKPEDLWVLKDIKEITGYLLIQQAPESVKNLSFFSGLEVIQGRQRTSSNALSIINMHIEYLGLTSLQKISNGDVMITFNEKLCYVHSMDLTPLLAAPNQIQRASRNRKKEECVAEGHVCDPECSEHGCWGPGPDKCIKCRNMQLEENKVCLPSCKSQPLLYQSGEKTCRMCHEQCADSCTGPEDKHCGQCKKVMVQSVKGHVCMEKCPEAQEDLFMYPDAKRVCRPCDPSCAMGCSGPSTDVKIGGCKTCFLAINETNVNGSVHCLPKDQEWCPPGYYVQQFRATVPDHPLMKKQVCQPCDPLCKECNAPGNSNCPVCTYLRHEGNCVEKCPQLTYAEDGNCYDCHDQCLECTGPNDTDCVNCKLFKIMVDQENKNKTFKCVEECPPELPEFAHDTDPKKPTKTVCADLNHPEVRAEKSKSKDAERKRLMTIIIPTCVGVLLLGGLLVIFGYCWRQRARAKENTVKLTAKMTGAVEAEPLTPTDAKPDLSKLRLIRESELRRGGIIGSGAFGTVYKGFWIPEGENVKIPVAIKILQEGTSPNQNQELLEEARVMASVEHPCCIRILAVCMATQMMLITQLMPLGCLLDYIRKHKENTGSKSLLNWCTQIARGMSYLEERGIVHRDLAARNVLVQSAGQVKITDFGLAKLLDYNEEEYHAAGGKMPIKWLALECIQHRIFTHKSDVWSYGVTVWELFTYGSRPYESVRARDVPDLLEKGERLPQPNICTIDVYMIMIKCWMLDADSRPSFMELAEEFAKMARDPGRYLVIQGDKLMRLPSYSYDKDDLARHLSVAGDGPEEVVEADDYLQPAPPVPLMADNNNVKSPRLVSPGGASNKEPSHLIREKRYGHLESAAAARQQRELSPSNRLRGDSINGRYSSDPVKYTRNRDELDGGNVFVKVPPPAMGNGSVPSHPYYQGSPRREPEHILHLPVDDDDYLQPKSANPKAYLDLEKGREYYLNEKQLSQESADKHEVPTPRTVPTSFFENPEYFEGDMPLNASLDKPLSPTSRNSVKPKIAPKPKKLTDYYNDLGNSTNGNDNRPLLSNSPSNCSNGEAAV